MKGPATLFVLVAALALPGTALAQFEPNATAGLAEGYRMDMLQSLVRDSTIPKPKGTPGSQSRDSGATASKTAAAATSAASPTRVTYRSEVSTRLRGEILRESTGNARSDELLRPVISSGRLMTEYGKLMRHLDLSSNDIADVMTAYLLVSMEAVNGQTPGARERSAARQAIADKLAASPDLRRLPADDRQVLAERYAYSTLSTGLTFQVLSRANRKAELDEFRTRVRRNVSRSTGIDPARVSMTETGLTAARR